MFSLWYNESLCVYNVRARTFHVTVYVTVSIRKISCSIVITPRHIRIIYILGGCWHGIVPHPKELLIKNKLFKEPLQVRPMH